MKRALIAIVIAISTLAAAKEKPKPVISIEMQRDAEHADAALYGASLNLTSTPLWRAREAAVYQRQSVQQKLQELCGPDWQPGRDAKGNYTCVSAQLSASDISGIYNPVSYAAVLTPGTNITSVTCVSATCTNLRGTITIVAGALATTGTIAALSWTSTPSAYVCTATMNGGATSFGIGNSIATTTGVNLTAAVSVVNATFTVNYSCQP